MICMDKKYIKYMNIAIELAKESAAEGEVPVGAVVVRRCDGLVAGRGRNRREGCRNALAHAEIEAIDNACRTLGGWRLSGCDMFVTLEPCPMCAGAAVNSRIDRIFFGCFDKKSGFCGSVCDISAVGGIYRPLVSGGIMEGQCRGIMENFFGRVRSRNMNGVKLVQAQTDDQLRRIAAIADEIWHEYFPCLLSGEQIDHMVKKFCSFEAEKENISREGYSYYFIKAKGRDVGYTAVKPDRDRLFLSKLYLFKAERGKHYASGAVAEIKEIARSMGLSAVWLTVNKHNDIAIRAYRGLGFELIGEGVTDIGKGFVMDDYYFELKC